MNCLKCSYILGSYAKFLWDAGDEDEEEDAVEKESTKTNTHPSHQNPSHFTNFYVM